jgi:hypothetical protein
LQNLTREEVAETTGVGGIANVALKKEDACLEKDEQNAASS